METRPVIVHSGNCRGCLRSTRAECRMTGEENVAGAGQKSDIHSMRCFYVNVHGKLIWRAEPIPGEDEPDAVTPRGFYCYRYVLAQNIEMAQTKAFQRVRRTLEEQTQWLSLGYVTLELDADEVAEAPMRMALEPDNKGFTYYLED